MSDTESSYVIPGSSAWGEGDVCPDGGACSPAITPHVIEAFDWVEIESIGVPADDETVDVAIGDAFPPSRASLTTLHANRETAEEAAGVLADGHELWAAVNQENRMSHLVAFDDRGRFAGVGEAMAEYFTVPVARLAAEAEAASGRDFLLSLFALP